MASSLRLEDPSTLAGQWQATLIEQGKPTSTCLINLEPDKTLGDGAQCLGAWIGQAPAGWFPEPDGISLSGAQGSRILFFGRHAEGLYQSTLKSGLIITLKRALQ